ncbi:MAG: acyl carrier protein [Candidatus Firestonebacteria bacterium]
MLEDLKLIIAKTIDVKNKEIKPETRISADLGADYLDMVEIQMAIEDKYKIDILSDRTIWKMKTVGELASAVEEKIKNKKG